MGLVLQHSTQANSLRYEIPSIRESYKSWFRQSNQTLNKGRNPLRLVPVNFALVLQHCVVGLVLQHSTQANSLRYEIPSIRESYKSWFRQSNQTLNKGRNPLRLVPVNFALVLQHCVIGLVCSTARRLTAYVTCRLTVDATKSLWIMKSLKQLAQTVNKGLFRC